MKKLHGNQCVLQLVEASDEAAPVQSLVYIHGLKANGLVSGAVLAVCVEIKRYYVVFSVDDNCFEGTLWIDLFDANLNLKDSINLTWIDSGSDFEFVGFENPESVVFEYFGRKYSLRVLDKRRFRVPFFSDVAEVWKGFRFSSCLEVKLLKKP